MRKLGRNFRSPSLESNLITFAKSLRKEAVRFALMCNMQQDFSPVTLL